MLHYCPDSLLLMRTRNVTRARLKFPWLILLLVCAIEASAADTNKTLRLALPVAESGFDPVVVHDLYSNTVLEGILEPMLAYDYLARPVKLVPNTLTAMPEVSDNGATYTFRVRPGIYFAADAAFKSTRRELIAADYAFSIKRLFDPKLKSPWLFLLEGKISGMEEAVKRAQGNQDKFDYDASIPGLEVLDRYTLRVRLKEPDFNLLYIFAMPTLGALAPEVVKHYGEDIGSHPVGTGPYYLKAWVRSHKIVLEANPVYRESYFVGEGENENDRAIVAHLKGKRLPIIGRVELTVIEESQPRYLAFLGGGLDYMGVPPDFVSIALPGGALAKNLERRGIRLARAAEPDVTYTFFNMEDSVVGGYQQDKIALRRAISLAYNTAQEIAIIRKNQAIPAQSPLPPGVAGYDPAFKTELTEYSPPKAKALLDLFGYKDRDGDGYRERPDGSPLVIEYASANTLVDRQFDELWKRNMDAVGIRVRFKKGTWPELLKQQKLGKLQVKGAAWIADYPDGDNFLQLLYGGNIGQANDSRFKLPEFDRLYEQAKRMPDSPERTRLYQQMTKLVLVYAPWKLGVHRIANQLVQPWIVGYKEHALIHAPWKYLDIDLERGRGTPP
jgi:oligopeptide transport system substrate-binding protein